MSFGRACTFSTLAAVIALAIPADAQSVISTHSGLIHFFDGAVYLDDRPLESHLGRFPSVPQDGELRTAEGRAEVLLTPGVFLRMGEHSAIRMVSNSLADTQVELETGAAIVDAGEASPDTSVTLIYKDWKVHFLRKGTYRIDSDPPRLLVSQGEAEVISNTTGLPVSVGQGMTLPLEGVLAPDLTSAASGDGLSNWAKGRGDSVSADNAILAQIDEDPDSRTGDIDGVTYFPFLGVMPSLGMNSPGLYGSATPYQTGFSSIYLPGYTYAPLIVGLMGPGLIGQRLGVRTYVPLPLSPRPIGVTTGAGSVLGMPRSPVISRAPIARPAAPIAAPRVGGVHAVGHK
jgi:hypothetical protein